MPLTEEERARIEANRRKAIEKRNKGGGGACAGVAAKSGSSSNQPLQATNNVPRSKVATVARSSSKSFYGLSGRRLSGVCSLSSAERFDVKIGYHEAVVAAVKALPSCRYEWGSFAEKNKPTNCGNIAMGKSRQTTG